jgi:hypothetical protein
MSAPAATPLQADDVQATSQSEKKDAVSVLGEGFQEPPPADSTSKPAESSDDEQEEVTVDGVKSKRRLFGFGRKKDEKGKGKKKVENNLDLSDKTPTASAEWRGSSPPLPSASNPSHPYQLYQSPTRNLQSSSPRVVSPAGSQIFERDVQESALPMPSSPAIPSHIQTEDHIPSVLDASSVAITNHSLDPDNVEIVMHSSHQPAAVTVTGFSSSEIGGGSWAEDLITHPDKDDAASNYGALDSADVRRLSFISFADVVQSEHAEHSSGREPLHIAGLTSLSSGHRSPSPMRSPVSSQGFGSSTPNSKSASIKGIELSPTRNSKPLGSPTLSFHGATGGELTIETMSQALRKTGSGDLSGPRSPVSPDGFSERLLR